MKRSKTVKNSKNRTIGVIGVDEVGRGPLAGPVTVCAVYLKHPKIVKKEIFSNIIRDSKKLTKSSRNKIVQTIRKSRYISKNVIYTISSRSSYNIDKYGINQSIKQCLRSCMLKLEKKGVPIHKIRINLDAGLVIPLKDLKQEDFVKGDENFVEIAVASILAKEYRDDYMNRLSLKNNQYGWAKNTGYGTLEHINAIKKYGITKWHRKTYIKNFKLFDYIK